MLWVLKMNERSRGVKCEDNECVFISLDGFDLGIPEMKGKIQICVKCENEYDG